MKKKFISLELTWENAEKLEKAVSNLWMSTSQFVRMAISKEVIYTIWTT